MAFAAGAAIVVGGSLLSADAQSDAADSAANAQTQASDKSVAEQRRQFDTLQKLLSPYVSSGSNALQNRDRLLGINGTVEQNDAIEALKNGSQYTQLLKAGNDSILANASATGGLRGGNTQTALAKFAPSLLSGVIQNQLGQLNGAAAAGQNAAAGTGAAALQTGNGIANAYTQAGQAQAGNALAQGKAQSDLFGSFAKLGGAFLGGGGF